MRELFPVLLVLFGLLLLATATSVGVVWWLSGGQASQQLSTILVYEVDPAARVDPLAVNMQEIVEVLDRRINPSTWTRRARLELRDDGRIEIGIFSGDADIEQWIVDRIERTGTLEFRVLANLDLDAQLVSRAAQGRSQAVSGAAGEEVARWVPVAAGEEMQFQQDPYLATRNAPGRDGLEVLVLHDGYNITGNYIEDASASVDDEGRPSIAFTLDATGGRLLSGLTGAHLPNFATGMNRHLGIILDGRLYSAPTIQSTIHRQGMITGSFTEPEAMQLADALRGGPLPAPLKQVERETPKPVP